MEKIKTALGEEEEEETLRFPAGQKQQIKRRIMKAAHIAGRICIHQRKKDCSDLGMPQ